MKNVPRKRLMVFKLKLAPSVSRMKIASCSHKASSWLPGGTRSPFLGEEGGEPQVGQADAFTGLRPSGAPGLEGGRRDELAKEKLRFQTWKKQEGTFYVPGDPGRLSSQPAAEGHLPGWAARSPLWSAAAGESRQPHKLG